jgi:hypothetical protein
MRLKATGPNAPHTSLEAFLENDCRVLRFYARWYDRSELSGQRRHIGVHSYLATKELEGEQLKDRTVRELVSSF